MQTPRDERTLWFHTLLRYKMPLTACLSPAGYSTKLQDKVSLEPIPLVLPLALVCDNSYKMTTLTNQVSIFGIVQESAPPVILVIPQFSLTPTPDTR